MIDTGEGSTSNDHGLMARSQRLPAKALGSGHPINSQKIDLTAISLGFYPPVPGQNRRAGNPEPRSCNRGDGDRLSFRRKTALARRRRMKGGRSRMRRPSTLPRLRTTHQVRGNAGGQIVLRICQKCVLCVAADAGTQPVIRHLCRHRCKRSNQYRPELAVAHA